MSDMNVVLIKKNGNSSDRMFPLTNDDRINITADSEKIPEGINSLEDLINALGALAFEDYVALNVSSENNYGLVKITNADYDDTDPEATPSNDTVPSAVLLHTLLSGKVSKTGAESISGVKTFNSGINIGGQVPITYDAQNDTIYYGTAPQAANA